MEKKEEKEKEVEIMNQEDVLAHWLNGHDSKIETAVERGSENENRWRERIHYEQKDF